IDQVFCQGADDAIAPGIDPADLLLMLARGFQHATSRGVNYRAHPAGLGVKRTPTDHNDLLADNPWRRRQVKRNCVATLPSRRLVVGRRIAVVGWVIAGWIGRGCRCGSGGGTDRDTRRGSRGNTIADAWSDDG